MHNFVLKIVSPEAQPEPWFRDRATYEFHVLNRAPMKKVQRAAGGDSVSGGVYGHTLRKG